MENRVGGKIFVKVDGVQYRAKGNFTWNLGEDKKEVLMGMDGPHGIIAKPQVAKIEGAITDRGDLSVKDLVNIEDATVILELASGKVISLGEAVFTGDGNVTTEEGEIEVEFQGLIKGQEVR